MCAWHCKTPRKLGKQQVKGERAKGHGGVRQVMGLAAEQPVRDEECLKYERRSNTALASPTVSGLSERLSKKIDRRGGGKEAVQKCLATARSKTEPRKVRKHGTEIITSMEGAKCPLHFGKGAAPPLNQEPVKAAPFQPSFIWTSAAWSFSKARSPSLSSTTQGIW